MLLSNQESLLAGVCGMVCKLFDDCYKIVAIYSTFKLLLQVSFVLLFCLFFLFLETPFIFEHVHLGSTLSYSGP